MRRHHGERIYKMFVENDVEMLEINPLIVTTQGDLKCSTPSSASTATRCSATPTSRHCATATEEDPKELEASKFDLNLHQLWTARSAAW